LIAITPKKRLASVRSFLNGAGLFALISAAIFTLPLLSFGATVSGVLIGSDGKPQADRQVHFEDRVTHDIFLAQTGTDGSFSLDLPPGVYQLRSEYGAAILPRIEVQDADIALGRVKESSAFDPFRLFSRQGVVRGILTTPAPSTANIPATEEMAGRPSTPAPSAASTPSAASSMSSSGK
jgi:hypothetical protein